MAVNESARSRPKLAVWKFASCDGCQLTLLNCEDELIPLAGAVEIAYFPEATRAEIEGPWDVSLVEGSVTTPEEAERIKEIREKSGLVVAIGACAIGGGVFAGSPQIRDGVASTLPVDVYVPGCPPRPEAIIEGMLMALAQRR